MITILLKTTLLAAGTLTFAASSALVLGSAGATPFIYRMDPTEPVVVYAQRFDLAQPYIHWWRAEKPQTRSGWLLVVKTDKDKLQLRQVATPVLYVGAQTAERINVGDESGHVVVLVPGDFELTEAPIYWGDAILPERVDGKWIDRELELARDRGVQAPTPDRMIEVLHDTLRLENVNQLRRAAADLIEKYSPTETDLVHGLRVRLLQK